MTFKGIINTIDWYQNELIVWLSQNSKVAVHKTKTVSCKTLKCCRAEEKQQNRVCIGHYEQPLSHYVHTSFDLLFGVNETLTHVIKLSFIMF